jgi:isopentenyl phosphate kinase
MLTLVKLGGSLITDKRVEKSFRRDVVLRLAQELAVAYTADPDMRLIIGHGSGSFGHFAASRANTIHGVHTIDEWKAFAHVSNVAAELNYLVCEVFESAGLPVWRIQPSASMRAESGNVVSLSIDPILTALSHGIIPVVYGDVSLDSSVGGTIISTEKLFFYLTSILQIDRIFLLGEVDGVYDQLGKVIQSITNQNYSFYFGSVGGSKGVDVTGGMETKVEDMLAVVDANSSVQIRIFSGLEEDLLTNALLGKAYPGTLISSY